MKASTHLAEPQVLLSSLSKEGYNGTESRGWAFQKHMECWDVVRRSSWWASTLHGSLLFHEAESFTFLEGELKRLTVPCECHHLGRGDFLQSLLAYWPLPTHLRKCGPGPLSLMMPQRFPWVSLLLARRRKFATASYGHHAPWLVSQGPQGLTKT